MLSSFKSSPCIVLVTHRPVNTVLRIRPCTQRYKEKRASVCLFPVASVPGFPWLSGVWSTGCACVSLAPRVVVLLQSYPLSRWKRHMFLWILFWKWCLPCLFSILYDAYNPYISIFFWFCCFCQWKQLWCQTSSSIPCGFLCTSHVVLQLLHIMSFVFSHVLIWSWVSR